MNEIDFVIPWVDGSDPDWQAQLKSYSVNPELEDARFERYRDWDNLHFWFRGVEKYAPWVRKIHFITHGHLPSWLNVNHPKLNIVRHKDYIPAEYLPVFSSHPIEIFINRIDELSEKFVYFNDDFFLINHVDQSDFFKNNIPCDIAAMNAISPGGVAHILLNNLEVISRNFNKRTVIKNNIWKWFNLKAFSKSLRTLALMPWPGFTGFYDPHSVQPYLKSTFDAVWHKEEKTLLNTARSRFRSITDINAYLFRYWQLCNGEFYQCNRDDFCRFFIMQDENIADICEYITQQKCKVITLNDDSGLDFHTVQARLNASFAELFPEKSSFEI